MKRTVHVEDGKPGLELLEEAAQLFRSAPVNTLTTYYAGTIPFVLGFLYFWVDMSRSPFAAQHLVEASLGMVGLFFWMKFCQASFASKIRAQLSMRPAPRWGLKGSLRVFLAQMTIHATGLLVLPLALIVMLPFAWVYAFYQNVTALADPDQAETTALIRRAWKQATLWIFQNHSALGIGLLFALGVFFNWVIVAFFVPSLLKMILGIETAFSRSPEAMVNTTFLGIVVGLTYLCADPILKIIYVLRCFYGESLQSGEDLKADLKEHSITSRRVAVLLVIAMALISATSLYAVQTPPAKSEVAPAQLDRQIDETISQSKYTWRLQRKTINEAEKGLLTRFFERVVRMIQEAVSAIARGIQYILERIFSGDSALNLPGFGWLTSSLLLFVLLTALACVLVVLLLRWRRHRAAAVAPVVAIPLQKLPDLTDETVRADELPVDGWTTLARELLDRGDYRLAMRAFYLASLAHLAQRNLVGIAHFKSNRDYENELQRRGHAIPELLPLFGENLITLERTWYGLHEADREQVLRFATNVDRMSASECKPDRAQPSSL